MPERGFTLVEVLVALAVTAFVAAASYAGLSAAISGVESTRAVAERTEEINRAFMLLSRDLRQLADRPVRDEFGDVEPALSGGRLAPFPLSLTRDGWHNSAGRQRSHLQRVSYYLDGDALWRLNYAVLDRSSDSIPQRVRLLDGVETLELRFLPRLEALQTTGTGPLDTRGWERNWVREVGSGTPPSPPAALEVRLELTGLGELRQLYVFPPI